MATAPFDTPKAKETLIRFGFPEEQATGVVTMTRDAILESVATKEDIADLKADIADLKANQKADVTDLKAAQKVDVTDLKAAQKVDVTDLKAAQKVDIGNLKVEIAQVEARLVGELTKNLGRTIAATGVMMAVFSAMIYLITKV